MKNCRLFASVLIIIFFSLAAWPSGGVLSSPRRVYLVKTNHFEILFPEESAQTAKLIADNADSLYEKAKSAVGLEKDFEMPIIISPDSATLKAKYTSHPYNRIVLYDSVAAKGQVKAEETFPSSPYLLSILYNEIFRAVSTSVRSPFNQLIYKTVGGDPYKPVSLVNLPFSFVEAFSSISSACADDSYYQQLLIQAKLENHFPSWFQAIARRDIHPGTDLNLAASTAFAAYLMNYYGVEKYLEFWHECGKLHFFFMNGIFQKVFGSSLSKVWSDFEETIPLPSDLAALEEFEQKGGVLFQTDSQGLYENLIYTSYGIIWYDGIRHEVDIYDFNGPLKIRQLLFIADNITRLSLSPDGRYLSLSFYRGKSREEFTEFITRIFDIKERTFLDYKLPLRDASFVQNDDGKTCLAGINVDQKLPILQVYYLMEDDESTELVYERAFAKDNIVTDLNPSKKGFLSYLLDGKIFIEAFSKEDDDEDSLFVNAWSLQDSSGNQLKPLTLNFISDKNSRYVFTYLPSDKGTLARYGYITLSEDFIPEQVFLQDADFSGGLYFPCPAGSKLYYSSRKFSHNELRYLEEKLIPFVQGSFAVSQVPVEKLYYAKEDDKTQNYLESYPLTIYNPFKYMMHMSITPFLAVRDISFDKGASLFPSLGLNISSDSDPMRNTEFIFSAGADFLVLTLKRYINEVPEESKENFNQLEDSLKEYTFAAYLTNASTPVDIAAGALINMSQSGVYDFKALVNTSWNIPIGTILRDINFSISSMYYSSTDYYDSNKAEYHPSKAGWTPFWDAYDVFEVEARAKYSNSHQYGISPYERRGLTAGLRLYSLWDMYELELLNDFRQSKMQQIESGLETELTQAQLESLYDENLKSISQLNMGLFATIEIPRLTPFDIKNGWVISMPATVHAALMNQTGRAFETNLELLLLGNEIQNGFPFLYLFFSRMGLKGGYNFCMNYDTTRVQLPDIRRDGYLYDVFSQTSITDCLYLLLDMDLIFTMGQLSNFPLKLTLKNEFFPRTKGYKFTLNLSANF